MLSETFGGGQRVRSSARLRPRSFRPVSRHRLYNEGGRLLRFPLIEESPMPEYIPSPRDWVREQVELYESSGGTKGTTLRDTGLPVIIVTNTGNTCGRTRPSRFATIRSSRRCGCARSRTKPSGHGSGILPSRRFLRMRSIRRRPLGRSRSSSQSPRGSGPRVMPEQVIARALRERGYFVRRNSWRRRGMHSEQTPWLNSASVRSPK